MAATGPAPTPTPTPTPDPITPNPSIGSVLNSALLELLASKKLVMALLTVLCALGAHLGLHYSAEQAFALVSPLIAAIVGQGIADHGKAAEQIRTRQRLIESRGLGRAQLQAEVIPPPSKIMALVALAGLIAIVVLFACGCSGSGRTIKQDLGAMGSEFLQCGKQDVFQLVGDKTLIKTVSEDLAKDNYADLFDSVAAKVGSDAAGCALFAIEDAASSALGIRAVTPMTAHLHDLIERHGYKRPPAAAAASASSGSAVSK